MARTGLRMMPTFPSPPLKFRTAGFPQYGFKASMSDRAFLQARNLKPAPGMRSLPRSLLLPFARFRHRKSPGSVSKTIEASPCRCAGAPRRPARPSLLSLPCFPYMLPTLPRWSTVPSRYTHTVVPGFLELLASHLPTAPVSASYSTDGVALFGAASFTLCYGLQVCLALLTGYDGMKSYALHRAF